MKNLIHVLLVLAALAVLAYPAGMAVDAAYGADVYLLSGTNDDSTVELNRALYFPGGGVDDSEDVRAVVDIYGSNPTLATERMLLFDDGGVIRPVEMRELALLPAGSAGGESYPLQSQSLLFATQRIAFAGLAAALVLLLIRRMLLGKGG